jgi:fumarylpyruvate hydrolase
MREIRVKDGTSLPVGKILCLGKNFSAHAREMGELEVKPPVVFLKPASAILLEGSPIVLPACSQNVHYEVELVVVIGKMGRNIPEEDVQEYILGYGVGLDLTARDLQAKAKKAGEPWTLSKGFDGAAPLSTIIPRDRVSRAVGEAEMYLRVNGQIRQQASLADMIWSISRTVSYLSRIFTLDCGDLIFMGTPEGVGPIQAGDHLQAYIDGIVSAQFEVVGAQGGE